MEAIVSMNASASFINATRLRSPAIQKVCFPSGSSTRGTLSCLTRADVEGDDGKRTIRLSIQAETPGKPEPAKLVIEVPSRGGEEEQEHARESVTHVASESAVESPEKVDEEAKHEAEAITSGDGQAVEKVARDLEDEASKQAGEYSRSSGVESLGDEIQRNVQGAAKATFEGGQRARQGFEAAREVVEKRASVLAEAAEEAGQRGSEVVEAARRSFQELRKNLGGVQGSASKVAEDVRKNVEDLQRKVEQQAQQVLGAKENGAEKLRSELEKTPQEMSASDVEKHRDVDPTDVNKDGEKKLAEQRRQSDEDRSVVSKAMEEVVDPALRSLGEGELREEPEIGDGNEHLKNMNDLVLHDSYAPVEDEPPAN